MRIVNLGGIAPIEHLPWEEEDESYDRQDGHPSEGGIFDEPTHGVILPESGVLIDVDDQGNEKVYLYYLID